MQINCWREVGRKNAPKDVVRARRIPAARITELRAAIHAARDHEGDGVLFHLERGYSHRGRTAARLVVGIGVVAVFLVAMAAFVAPSAAGSLIGFGLVPAVLVVGATAGISYVYDTGVQVRADGALRCEGWGGIRELDLASYPRVTVLADKPRSDVGWIES